MHKSYAAGVPMGADLPAMPSGKGVAPSFVVWAVKDPSSANLDRIQVIKGFQAMRERLRRRIIEKAGAQLMDKLEARAGDWL